MFVARLDMLPRGVTKFGTSSKACLGGIFMGVNRMPRLSDPGFTVTCTGAPPNSTGLLFVSFNRLTKRRPFHNVTLFVPGDVMIPTASSSRGYAEVTLPLHPRMLRNTLYAQFVWNNTKSCGEAELLSSSNALEIVAQ